MGRTPLKQHPAPPLVFDTNYHSLALHDKSVIQPLHHHHQQSVADFPREFEARMRNDNPSLQLYVPTPTIIKRQCFEQCHHRRTTSNPSIFSPHVYVPTNLRPLMCLKGF